MWLRIHYVAYTRLGCAQSNHTRSCSLASVFIFSLETMHSSTRGTALIAKTHIIVHVLIGRTGTQNKWRERGNNADRSSFVYATIITFPVCNVLHDHLCYRLHMTYYDDHRATRPITIFHDAGVVCDSDRSVVGGIMCARSLYYTTWHYFDWNIIGTRDVDTAYIYVNRTGSIGIKKKLSFYCTIFTFYIMCVCGGNGSRACN